MELKDKKVFAVNAFLTAETQKNSKRKRRNFNIIKTK
jgi:hypothetical protein